MDLRLRIVRTVERGSSIRAAAPRIAVSPAAAIKLMQRVRAIGSAAPHQPTVHAISTTATTVLRKVKML